MFRCLQKVSSKITFLQSIFAAFLVVLGPFWLYEEFGDRYRKKPVSVTKKDISDYNYWSIYNSLWFYGSGFGCKNSLKMATFRPKMRILWHNAVLLELLNPENHRTTAQSLVSPWLVSAVVLLLCWKWLALTMYYNISKSQKARYHLKIIGYTTFYTYRYSA